MFLLGFKKISIFYLFYFFLTKKYLFFFLKNLFFKNYKMRAAGQPTDENHTNNNQQQPDSLEGLTLNEVFLNSTINGYKIKTVEERQREIKKEFTKFKTTINRHLKKAHEYYNRIEERYKYETTTELKLSIEMESADTELNEILEDLNQEPNKLNEEIINKIYKDFDIIFNNFITIREHYRPFITNPAKNKGVAKIFILKGIDFKANKKLWLKTFKEINKRSLFYNLINDAWREINDIKDKTEDKNNSKIYDKIKEIDEAHNNLIKYLDDYKNKIIEDFKAYNRQVSENLRQNGGVLEDDIKENQDYFDEEAIKTASKMCDPSGDLLGKFYKFEIEISNLFIEYSRQYEEDHDDFINSELINMYQTLIEKINELFKTNFKKQKKIKHN